MSINIGYTNHIKVQAPLKENNYNFNQDVNTFTTLDERKTYSDLLLQLGQRTTALWIQQYVLSKENKKLRKLLELTYPYLKKSWKMNYNEAIFHYTRWWIQGMPLCVTCKEKHVRFLGLLEWYCKNCSLVCSNRNKETQKKKKETSLKHYWTEFPIQNKQIQQKVKDTCQIRYDTQSYSQTIECKNKVKETSLQKYNSENYFSSQEWKNKVKQVLFERYWVDNVWKLDVIQNKIIKQLRQKSLDILSSKLLKYVKNDNLYQDFLNKYINNETSQNDINMFTCKDCWQRFSWKTSLIDSWFKCLNCFPIQDSIAELEIIKTLSNLGLWEQIVIHNRTILKPKELDIYIPHFNLAIEYNGLMYHSIWLYPQHKMFITPEMEIQYKDYHYNKTQLCESKWIQLLHIFENEWLNPIKQDIWKSIISNKCKLNKSITQSIYARKCDIRVINSQESKQFLDKNHLQWNAHSSIRLWLYYNNELVQLMTFGKPRFSKTYDWELYRFATKTYTQVIWGASKIFKHFINNYVKKWESIVTYADRRYSQWQVYNVLGFTQIEKQKMLNYYYFNSNIWLNKVVLYSRIKFQKHKLKNLYERWLLISYDESLTESQNMYNNWYRKIYDCGNLVFEYIK